MSDLTVSRTQTVIDPKERARRLAACYRIILKARSKSIKSGEEQLLGTDDCSELTLSDIESEQGEEK